MHPLFVSLEASFLFLHKAHQGAIHYIYGLSQSGVWYGVLNPNFDLQSVGKEFLNTTRSAAVTVKEGFGKVLYRFSAFKPGKATLTFEYGYALTARCTICI